MDNFAFVPIVRESLVLGAGKANQSVALVEGHG